MRIKTSKALLIVAIMIGLALVLKNMFRRTRKTSRRDPSFNSGSNPPTQQHRREDKNPSFPKPAATDSTSVVIDPVSPDNSKLDELRKIGLYFGSHLSTKLLETEASSKTDLSRNNVKPGSLDESQSEELSEFLKLSKLERYNSLYRKSGDISSLSNCGNNLVSIPEEIGKLSNLKRLYLTNNANLKALPDSITNLIELSDLDLSYNDLESIPEEIGKLTNLVKFILSNNANLKAIPDPITNLIKLWHLDLSYNNLESIPKEIGKLSNLKYLYLNNNNLKSIPSSIGDLKKLEILKLSFNKLELITESIGDLTNLKILILSSNNLKSMPNKLKDLSNLKVLDLSKNNLGEIPEQIGKLVSLIGLYLSNNTNLTLIPDSIGDLKNLIKLDLSNNTNLTLIPDSIGKLSSLEFLNLKNTNLQSLPRSIADLKGSIQEIYIDAGRLIKKTDEDLGEKEIIHIFGSRVKFDNK